MNVLEILGEAIVYVGPDKREESLDHFMHLLRQDLTRAMSRLSLEMYSSRSQAVSYSTRRRTPLLYHYRLWREVVRMTAAMPVTTTNQFVA